MPQGAPSDQQGACGMTVILFVAKNSDTFWE